MKKNLLLHACCAPCLSSVFEELHTDYTVSIFFYNPNITPHSEYAMRQSEVNRFVSLKKLDFFTGLHDVRRWADRVKKYRFAGERSIRCRECYRLRLEVTFLKAQELKSDCVTTTLSVSPYKDAEALNAIGRELEKEYGIEYLESDFKKNDGYKRSIELSKQYGFYRQKYCGCIYSRLEHERNESWMKKVKAYSE